MELETQDVNGSDWDYLIVLDACRYDYFRENYEDFLEGELLKKRTKGTSTPEWLRKTFTSRYNYKYVSANPYCNGKGVSHQDQMPGYEEDWNAVNKFTEIIDSWEKDWDEEENTVRPEDITDTALEEDNGGKMIVHYIQPHRPYISCPVKSKPWDDHERVGSLAEGEDYEKETTLKRDLIEATRPYWSKFFWKLPYRTRWKIKNLLGLKNPHWGALVQEVGEDGVRKYYQQDLRMALEQVARLIEELDGKVVVTADHGEALGEHNDWGHQEESDNPKQYTVPWLKVEGVVND
jgi:hypothetical protein